MSIVKCKAVIVSETTYNENDKMLTAISDEFGKISISVRGAKKPNSRFLAISQLFCYSEMELREGKNGIYTLSDATLISSFYDLRTDLDVLTFAQNISKIAQKVSQEELPDNDLMRLFLNTLFALDKRLKDPNLIMSIFVIRLVFDQGLLPEFSIKLPATNQALNYIISADFSKLFLFSVSDSVLAELKSIEQKALKYLNQ